MSKYLGTCVHIIKKHIAYTVICMGLWQTPVLYATSLHAFSVGFQNDKDRKLSKEEVQERGLDILANTLIENINTIDLKKMARSSIFETTYGFRWKMFNLQTGTTIIIKVDKNFKLISARNSSFDS